MQTDGFEEIKISRMDIEPYYDPNSDDGTKVGWW